MLVNILQQKVSSQKQCLTFNALIFLIKSPLNLGHEKMIRGPLKGLMQVIH